VAEIIEATATARHPIAMGSVFFDGLAGIALGHLNGCRCLRFEHRFEPSTAPTIHRHLQNRLQLLSGSAGEAPMSSRVWNQAPGRRSAVRQSDLAG